MNLHILIVEDNNDHAMILKACLEAVVEPHYIVERAATIQEAIDRLTISKDSSVLLEQVKKTDPLDTAQVERLEALVIEGVLLDLSLPDSRGDKTGAVTKVKEASKHVGIVVHTGWSGDQLEQVVKDKGANALLIKGNATPIDVSRELQFAIIQKKHELEEHKLEETLRRIGKLVDKLGTE